VQLQVNTSKSRQTRYECIGIISGNRSVDIEPLSVQRKKSKGKYVILDIYIVLARKKYIYYDKRGAPLTGAQPERIRPDENDSQTLLLHF
jgi:hypothetical protein